jgi:UPF0042 nucleotide-binding protein
MSPRARARSTPAASSSRFVVLTGLSGAGKSQAIRALEDLGFFCVDNLPVALIPTLAELMLRTPTDIPRAAVVVDVREGAFLEQFPSVYRHLRRIEQLAPTLIFLEASDGALVRRFSETRRPHPLTRGASPLEGIREERRRLTPIRRMADQILDTSDMTVHELRHAFLNVSRGAAGGHGLVATFLSFGFKHGLPVEADLVFDVRFLPNPHFVPELREKTGRDPAVGAFLAAQPDTRAFLDHVLALLRFLLPRYVSEGKSSVTVAIGCTGGKHRSVALADWLRKELAGTEGVRLRVRHRDIAAE